MNTRIANRIWIEDPSDEIAEWAKKHLRFPNPEYEKKERMGFWLGRTPKEIRLYERNGRVLILPFGVIREIMPMLRDTLVTPLFQQDTVINYGDAVPLYDYQAEAVRQMVAAKYGILKATTGSGKTQMGIAIIKQVRRRALWLCHTADLLKQSGDRALRYMDEGLIGTITEGKVDVGVGVTFATVQTMANLELTQYRDYWDVVIVDECFPGYTSIVTEDGFKRIKDITKRDKVLTVSDNGKLEYKKVLTRFKKVPQSLVIVYLKNGTEICCTGNHPILTKEGYKRADELSDYDSVFCLRETNGYLGNEPIEKIQHPSQKDQSILLGRMQTESRERLDRGTQGIKPATDEKTKCGKSIGSDEEKQSNASHGNKGTCQQKIARNGSQTDSTRREWNGFDETTGNTDAVIEEPVSCCGVRCTDENSEGERVSNELQTGYSDSGNSVGDRSGREFALFTQETGTGPEERFMSEFVGVDRVEVQEQSGDGTYGDLCPDGYVYNIEVEGNHNYFANGVNVHNCHRVSSSATTFTRYEKVLNHLAARHKYGLTATPERSDGLIQATFALLGKVAYEVPEDAVADRVMGVKIRTVETETDITDECLNDDGTINYVNLITYLTENEARNRLIAEKIIENREHSCLILSERLSQLGAIMGYLPEDMQEEMAFVNGNMTSKVAKVAREQMIEKMRTGEKKYLFASYSLAREGLDIPCLDRLFLASPVKYSAIVIQAVGRVRRTAEGKEVPVVYDFRDVNIGFCDRAYRERCRSYRKMGAEIEKGFLR